MIEGYYLHNKCRVFVAFFWKSVELGDGVIEGRFGEAKRIIKIEDNKENVL